jgi:hypothetical protein
MNSRSLYDDWQGHMDCLDSRIRREQLRYAAFRAQRHHLSTTMLPTEYVAFANSVSMRLVFYDPNFDFRNPLTTSSAS